MYCIPNIRDFLAQIAAQIADMIGRIVNDFSDRFMNGRHYVGVHQGATLGFGVVPAEFLRFFLYFLSM
jgi:hypothetical protein